MIILFLDVNKQEISLYKEDGITTISFQDAGQLPKYTENKEFLYITNAIKTTSTEVISMINSMGVPIKEIKPEKLTYIHIAGEGVIPIDDNLRFRGKYDAHPLTAELIQKIKSTPLLTQLVESGKLELITSPIRKKLEEERVRKEDEKMGGILINGPVDDFIVNQDVNHQGAEVIDLGVGVSSATKVNEMEELMERMEGLE